MVSPNVWGSLATAGIEDAWADNLTGRWYSASALDYYLRKHFRHWSHVRQYQWHVLAISVRGPGRLCGAFQRNLLFFKQDRHLLFQDVYHPKLGDAGWSSVQYVEEDSTESVVYIFRDKSEAADTTIRLRGLDNKAKYRVTSLNDRPGREES